MAFTVIGLALLLFIQNISSQYIGNPLNPGMNGLPYGNFPNPGNLNLQNPGYPGPGCGATASTGGSFAVTSTSPIAPTGVSILAENLAIEGPLSVGGQLPFLGTIGVEGALPAIGSGAVSYGCGGGNIGITNEGLLGANAQGPYSLAASNNPGLTSSTYPLANPGLPSYNGLPGPGFAANAYGPGLPGQGFGSGLAGVGLGTGLPGPGLGYGGIGGIPPGVAF